MLDLEKRKSNLQAAIKETDDAYKEREKACEAAKDAYDKALNDFHRIKKKLEDNRERMRRQRDELWKELEVHSKNFIQMVYWNSNTGYPGLTEILYNLTIKDNKIQPEAFLYYQAFNPKSPMPGVYYNDFPASSEILKTDPRLKKLEKCIYGKNGIVIDISKNSTTGAKEVVEALLPVVFFFLVYKKKNCKEAVKAARDFFQVHPRWGYSEGVYDLL